MRNFSGLPPVGEGVVNVASVPQRSPFRYPGGKTWFVPYVRRWIHSLACKPRVFVEPFGGGGIVSLTVASENLADHVVLGELDVPVAAVWETILSKDAEWLAQRILQFKMSREAVVGIVSMTPRSRQELAFQTIVRNRVQRGGILAPGAGLVRNGENHRGVGSRWYPKTLARRVREIADMRERIEFIRGDAFDLMARFLRRATACVFLDPPYTAGGKRSGRRLYMHNEIDHQRLFEAAANSGGAVMLTYDEAEEVLELARRYEFKVERVPMKNTHHAVVNELVISNRGSCFGTNQRRGRGIAC